MFEILKNLYNGRMTRGLEWSQEIRAEAFRMMASGASNLAIEAALGVPDATLGDWRRAALSAQTEPRTLAAIWESVQRDAAKAASESLQALDRREPDAARAIAAIGKLAHEAYLDHTVGRRGVQLNVDNSTHVHGDAVLLAIQDARERLAQGTLIQLDSGEDKKFPGSGNETLIQSESSPADGAVLYMEATESIASRDAPSSDSANDAPAAVPDDAPAMPAAASPALEPEMEPAPAAGSQGGPAPAGRVGRARRRKKVPPLAEPPAATSFGAQEDSHGP